MNELSVHPNVYATGRSKGLLAMLEILWLREQSAGDGTMYIVSGFANYNGGVRFYPVFRNHVDNGGKVIAVFAGSTRQKLTSRQVVTALLECGVEVHRTGENHYELRLFRHDNVVATVLDAHAVHPIGHQGKRYGFLSNSEFQVVSGVHVGRHSSR